MESHSGPKQRLIYKRAVARARLSRGSREGVDGVQQNKVQRVDASRQTRTTRLYIYRVSPLRSPSISPPLRPPCLSPCASQPFRTNTPIITLSSAMAPKPASTAGKAPASTASKAPAKTTSEGGSKAAKKTSKAAASGGEGEKKKRRKGRKETYSSYIYKGACPQLEDDGFEANPESGFQCSSRYTLTPVSPTRRWPFSTPSSTTSSSVSRRRHPVRSTACLGGW